MLPANSIVSRMNGWLQKKSTQSNDCVLKTTQVSRTGELLKDHSLPVSWTSFSMLDVAFFTYLSNQAIISAWV